MPSFIDMTGQEFGRLTVLHRAPNQGKRTMWVCRCECGNETIVERGNLVGGRMKSCGCLKNARISEVNKTHGLTHTRLHRIWLNMKTRCFNPKFKQYENYMGRGITMCDEWRDSFKAFYDWAMANGYKDNLSIDRINNDGNYEPSNCRWADNYVQSGNRRPRRWGKKPST